MTAAVDYNTTRAAALWVQSQLPPPFRTLDPRTQAFACYNPCHGPAALP